MANEIIGVIGALMAALFFGSNYVPTKNYPTGDGISFVWSFSSGVLIVGIISIFVSGHAVFVYSGLLGGSLWATGNLCVIPIVKMIGLGPGMLLWGSTSLITGFFVGKFGIFGVDKQQILHEGMNWGGIAFVLAALGSFFFIKPTIESREEYQPLSGERSRGDIQDKVEESSIWDRIPTHLRPVLGGGLAVASGMLYGVNMVPMSLWQQYYKAHHNGESPGTLDFVFSHFTGIYLYSSIIFFVYCIVNRPPKIFPASIFPSIISGAMWGIAQCGLMSATSVLGYAVGFPIGSAGPMMVSSLWSVFYFREIRGSRNLAFLSLFFILLLVGISLLALSNVSKV